MDSQPSRFVFFLYATSSMTPPASVILRSASLLTYLARTTKGISGQWPFPVRFEHPRANWSITGGVSFASPATYFSRMSWGRREASCKGETLLVRLLQNANLSNRRASEGDDVSIYLVNVDCGLPLVVSQQVESSHTNLTEVTRMIFVDVGTVVVLSGHISHSIRHLVILGLGIFFSALPDHQPYHDHRGASCAFLYDHDRH